MKKLFYAVVALSLFATSCAKDAVDAPEAAAKTKTVTFSVKAPVMQTRASEDTKPGTGANANKLYYAFYDESGRVDAISKYEGIGFDGDETVEVTLVEGKSYTAIFWAQNDGSEYIVSMPETLASAQVSMNYGTEVANSENYDAFWAVVPEIEKVTTDIKLQRPFAQLNIGVTSTNIATGAAAGVNVASVKATVGGIPTTFNLATGTVDGDATVTFDWVTAGTWKETFSGTEYTIYSTNYVLVGTPVNSQEKTLASVVFDMSESAADDAADDEYNISRDFGAAVPVQANYRTFILGDIITGGDDASHTWTVKIDPIFVVGDKVENK